MQGLGYSIRLAVKRGRAAAVIIALVVVPGCSGDEGGGSQVDWDNYAPSVQSRIDSLAAQGDCQGLQDEFDVADANDSIQRDRVGDGNADLMGYIDAKMQSARCSS
jgi:hypothetical protein